jgi:hypothetical protein
LAGEDPVHRARRGDVLALVQQLRADLGRRQVDEARLLERVGADAKAEFEAKTLLAGAVSARRGSQRSRSRGSEPLAMLGPSRARVQAHGEGQSEAVRDTRNRRPAPQGLGSSALSMAVTATTFSSLSKQTLEEFLEYLVRAEREERFAAGVVEIDPPSDEDVSDGGRDLRVVIASSAERRVNDALLPDGPGEVWFSCKTKNDPSSTGDGWRNTVRKEVDPDDAWKKLDQGNLDAATRKAALRPKEELYQMLADGGSYRVILNWGPGKVEEFRRELVERLEFRVGQFCGRELELDKQIKIFPAGYLAAATRRLHDHLPSEARELLPVDEPAFLSRWAEWTRAFEADREPMEFRTDAEREDLFEELRAFLLTPRPEGEDKVMHLWGPPGVGKTRLVHEVLKQSPELHSRVRYTQDHVGLGAWLGRSPGELAADPILVVDELEVDLGPRAVLFRPFERATNARPDARLIAIGPQDDSYAGQPTPRTLRPLAEDTIRTILQGEMGTEDERVERVLRLCEGYPLFALWLGKALAADMSLLADPSFRLTAGDDPWQATAAVLGGSPEQATLRGKALLLVVLAPKPWRQLGAEEQGALAGALQAGWGELLEAARATEHRGLLRDIADGRRYISPANLERLIINHFFGPKGPLEPEDLVALGGCYARLQKRAAKVDASAACQQRLARGCLRALAKMVEGGELSRARALSSGLSWSSHVDPEHAGPALREIVDRLGRRALDEQPELLGSIRASFEHIARRRISAAAFAAVESGLFDLAGCRLEPWGNNAKAVWASLFAPVLHLTHRPFEERFARLTRRLRRGTSEARVLALAGLGAALERRTTMGIGVGWDDVDAPWEHEQQPRPDYAARLEAAWALVIELARDPDPAVADAARQLAVDNFRTGLDAGLRPDLLESIADQLGEWSVDQRNALDERLTSARHYELRQASSRARWGSALERLEAGLRPTSLAAELSAQVGRWHPGPWPLDDEARQQKVVEADKALARRFVARPEQLREVGEWLRSEAAHRRPDFARALGQVDADMVCLPVLLAWPPGIASEDFISVYLAGWAERAGDDAFDAWIEARVGALPTQVIAQALIRSGGNDRRAELLASLMRAPDFSARALAGLGFHRTWAEDVDLALIDRLIAAAADLGEEAHPYALWLVAARLRRSTDLGALAPRVHAILESTGKQRRAAVTSIAWVDSVVALALAGDLRVLRRTLEWATRRVGFEHDLVEVLRRLAKDGDHHELWPAFASVLDTDSSASQLAFLIDQLCEQQPGLRARLLEPERVLAWVGDDEERGRRAAQLAALHSTQLDPLARALVERFGANNSVARALAGRATGTLRTVTSLEDFSASQARRARGWAEGGSPELRRWAEELARCLEDDARREAERTEYERRYG